jgi:hypothetical protein
MKRFVLIVAILVLAATTLAAQEADTTRAGSEEPAPEKEPAGNRIYYGGTIGLNFGDYFRIRIAPLVGYRVSRSVSAGIKAAYEYIEDTRYTETVTSSNFGGSVFSRYRLHPKAYAHVEFATMSYKYSTAQTESDRQWVPFILVGGGLVQPIGRNAAAYVEVLFDVLQDDKSPYKDWEPWVSIGVGVGF